MTCVFPFIYSLHSTQDEFVLSVGANFGVTQRWEQRRQSQSGLVLHQYASEFSWASGQQRWDSCWASADGPGHDRGPNKRRSVPALLAACCLRAGGWAWTLQSCRHPQPVSWERRVFKKHFNMQPTCYNDSLDGIQVITIRISMQCLILDESANIRYVVLTFNCYI